MMKGYTHLAELYGVRCWYNEDTNEVRGTNWFNEFLLDVFICFDTTFNINDGFYIKLIEKL